MDKIYLTVNEITILLQVTRQAVCKWIKNGSLVAYKVDSRWRINPSDLELFLSKRKSV